MKTKRSITKKREAKIEEMKRKADFKFDVLLANKKRKFEKNRDYEIEKNERKKRAYINKKEAEYHKKMLNEIRELN